MKLKGMSLTMICWAFLLALLVSVDGNGKSDDKIQNAMRALTNKLESVEERVNLMKRSTQSDGHGEKEKGGSDDGLFDTFFHTGSGEGESSHGKGVKDLKSKEALGDQENARRKTLSSTGFRSWKAGGLERGEIPSEDLAEKKNKNRNGGKGEGDLKTGEASGESDSSGKDEKDLEPEEELGDQESASEEAGVRKVRKLRFGYGRYGYRNGNGDHHLKGYGPIIMPGDKKRKGGKGEGDLKTEEASGESGSSGKDKTDRESRKYRNGLKYETKNNPKKDSDKAGYRNGYSYDRYGYRNGYGHDRYGYRSGYGHDRYGYRNGYGYGRYGYRKLGKREEAKYSNEYKSIAASRGKGTKALYLG